MESSGETPLPPPAHGGQPSGVHDYPLTFSVDCPDRGPDRASTAFRIFTIIPIAILAGTIEGGGFETTAGARYIGGGIGILFIPVVLMLLFREKYPRWWTIAIHAPTIIVLFFLSTGAIFTAIFAWFAILFTGRYPRGCSTAALTGQAGSATRSRRRAKCGET